MKISRKNALDFCLVLAGKISISAVVFLGGVLLARASGAAEFALFSVVISAVLLCDGMIGAPLDLAAVRFTALHPDEPARTRSFEAMAMQLKLLLVASLFLAALAAPFIVPQWRANAGVRSFPVVPCVLATTGLLMARSVGVGLQISRRFKIYSLVDVGQGVARILGFALLVPLGLARAGAYILAYGIAAFSAASFGITFLDQKYLLGRWPSGPDRGRMLRYCGYSSGIIACGTATGRGDILILAMIRGSDRVGAYGLASQMAMLVGQVALYASVLTAPRLIPLAREGGLRRLFFSNFLLVAVVALFACVALRPAFLDWGTHLVFGKGFGGAIPILQILLFGAIVDLLIVPVLMSFCVQACPAGAFAGEVVIAAAFVIAALAAATSRLPWPPQEAMACVAASARLAKLALYFGLFAARTSPDAIAAL